MKERLSKHISGRGVASRRKAEAMIKVGRVKVNGKRVLEPFVDIDPEIDHITVDNITLSQTPRQNLYLALHKPSGYISDLADPRARPLARDLIRISGRFFPVGRLDFTSEGLIIFTNDGDFAQKILHPSYEIEREYVVKMQKPLTEDEIKTLVSGRRFEGILYRLHSVTLMNKTEKNAWYRIIAKEGRNRMIRKLADSLGHTVLRLRRTRIGPVTLGSLKPGQYRFLTTGEIAKIADRSRRKKVPDASDIR